MDFLGFEFLEVPDPRNAGATLRYDLREAHRAEARVAEIATVTPATAPELMATFSRGCFGLGRYLASLHYAHRLAKKRVGDRKAVLVVDI